MNTWTTLNVVVWIVAWSFYMPIKSKVFIPYSKLELFSQYYTAKVFKWIVV